MEKLVLASCSPRRRQLLSLAGIPFDAVSPDVDESVSLPAAEAVAVLSARKARAGGELFPGRRVLAADTLVALEGVPLGKPKDPDDAVRMLRALSGKTHQVYTGVSVLSPEGRLFTGSDASDVTFCPIPEAEILRPAPMRSRGGPPCGSPAWREAIPPLSVCRFIWCEGSCSKAATVLIRKVRIRKY